MRFRLHPLTVFPVFSLLGYLSDVDLWIEVGGKCLTVIAGITVDDIEIMDLIEMMFGGVSGKDTGYTRVESATEDGGQAGFLKLILVGPLPFVLELGFILRFIIGRVEVVDATRQTGIHNGQVLVRQCHIDHQLRLIGIHQ